MTPRATSPRLTFHPLTPERWDDLVTLFGPRGACAGCWCMWFHQTQRENTERSGAKNKRAFKRKIDLGEELGVLAYRGEEAIGWVSIAPREAYSALKRSRVRKPLDEKPAWSIVCLFVKQGHRRRGVSTALINAAKRHAKARGAKIVEGYPIDTDKGNWPDIYFYPGTLAAFQAAGFREVARRTPTRPFMRCALG